MPRGPNRLSAKSKVVLTLIANGYTYERILSSHPDLTYHDIFKAAREALESAVETDNEDSRTLSRIRRTHPHAYEKWSDQEVAQLERLVRLGKGVDEIAMLHGRQPSAIRSRMARMNLTEANQPVEAEPFEESNDADVPL